MNAAAVQHAPEVVEGFFEAVRSGNVGRVIVMVSDHGDSIVNTRDAKGSTPLIRAIEFNKTSLVQTLLDNGADVNAVDAQGSTALIHASGSPSSWGRLIMWYLLHNGADPDVRNIHGMTALMYACSAAEDRVECLQMFGANPLVKNNFDQTASTFAKALRLSETVCSMLDTYVEKYEQYIRERAIAEAAAKEEAEADAAALALAAVMISRLKKLPNKVHFRSGP